MNSAHTREDKRWTAKRVATRCTSASTPWLTRTSQFRIPWASGAPPVSHFSLHSSASLKPLLSPALTHPLLRSLQNPHNPSSPVTGGCSRLQRKQLYLQLPLITFASGGKLSLCQQLAAMAGSGPEYDYPVTRKDEPIPVVGNEDPVAEAGMPVVGEDAREMNDKDIAEEERLEAREAGEWSEDMASRKPLSGEEDPDLYERLPNDRG